MARSLRTIVGTIGAAAAALSAASLTPVIFAGLAAIPVRLRRSMARSLRLITGTVVAAAATATLVWMPTLVLAGISFQALE